MSNVITYISMKGLQWYIVSGLDNQLQQWEINNPACKKLVQGCKMWRIKYCFFLINTNLWLSGQDELQWVGLYGFDSCRVLRFSAATRPFLRGTEPVSALTLGLLYCCTIYILFFLDIISGDLALTGFHFLTWTSDNHCFGALGVGPATCVGLEHWHDYSYSADLLAHCHRLFSFLHARCCASTKRARGWQAAAQSNQGG